MDTLVYTFETVDEYKLAQHGLRNFADQIIERDGDTLTITVTEFGACCIESAIGHRISAKLS